MGDNVPCVMRAPRLDGQCHLRSPRFTVARHVREDCMGERRARVAHINAICDVQGVSFTCVSVSFVVV